MATQTPTKRQATASKATATRKRNAAATKSAAGTKASARRPKSAARTTSGSSRLEAFARQAEWVALIPVGVALEARDLMIATAHTYSDARRAKRRLDRFERRGATALRRNRRTLEHKTRVTRRDIAQRTNGWRSDAENLVEEVRSII
jgi:hypothetical protein